MNRAQRRAAARQSRRGDHLDCGCHQRYIVPLDPPACPDCGVVSPVIPRGGMPWPTSTPPGSLLTMQVGCTCGTEFDLTCIVEN